MSFIRADTVWIMNPDDNAVKAFVTALASDVKGGCLHRSSSRGDSNMHLFLNSLTEDKGAKFELLVLEAALANVTNKFKRHLNLLKPVADLLPQASHELSSFLIFSNHVDCGWIIHSTTG